VIDEALFTRLSGFAGLSSLVGSRIYPVMLPQSPTYPAISHFSIGGGETVMAMGSDPGLVVAQWQFSAWGSKAKDARDAIEQVRLALQRFRGTVSGTVIQDILADGPMRREPPELVDGVLVFQFSRDFRIWYVEG
jgi:hypothetical protein